MSTGVPRLLSGTFLLLAMSSSAQSQTFSVTLLDSFPDSSGSYAGRVNNRGQVLAGVYTANGPHTVLWDNGLITDLYPLGPSEINNRGEMVGFIWGSEAVPGYIYSRGTLTILPTLPGSVTYPISVNARGDIVGQAVFDTTYAPFIYRQGSISRLPLLPGDGYGYATAINDSGQVIGFSMSGTDPEHGFGPLHSFFYSNGSIWKINPLLFDGLVGVIGLNNAGAAVGVAGFDSAGSISHAFLYSGGATVDLGVPPGFTSSQAEAINLAGVIVGEAYFTNYGQTSHAFLYANGLWKDLNDLIPQTPGLVLKWASSINERGEIAGTATLNGQDVAYLLRPLGDEIISGGFSLGPSTAAQSQNP